MLLNESILFILQFKGDVVFLCKFFILFRHSLDFELLYYFRSLSFFMLDLLHNFCLVTLLAKICELAHGLIQHRKELVRLQVKVVLQRIDRLVLETESNQDCSLHWRQTDNSER